MNARVWRFMSLPVGTFLLILMAWLFLVKGGVPAVADGSRTLFVAPEGRGTACTQAHPCALSTALARAVDGDVIYLAGGTYTGAGAAVITITKSITLYGGWDGAPTGPVVRDPDARPSVLDGEGRRRGVFIYSPVTVRLDGLIIVRGNASTAPDFPGQGGGLFIRNATPIIANCIISGNVAYTGTAIPGIGGGIRLVRPQGTAVITGNRIIANVASMSGRGAGGGIDLLNASGVRVVNNIILSNTAAMSTGDGYGGGIAVEGPHSRGVVLSGNWLQGNVALARGDGHGRGYGGGVDIGSPSVLITGNVVVSNTAILTGGLGYGGGIALLSTDRATVMANRIEHNVAQAGQSIPTWSYGGGIYCYLGHNTRITDNVLRHNTASAYYRGGGGGITLWWHCDKTAIVGNRIEGNRGAAGLGDGRGGGMYLYTSHDVRIEANRVLSNVAGAGIFGGSAGGLYIRRDTRFTMTNNIVAGNDATLQGGGVLLEPWATGPITGALVHNTFAANSRGKGEGRVAIYVGDANATLVMTNNLIYSHTAGLIVAAGSTATLYNTLFYGQSEKNTGGEGVIVNHHSITGRNPLLDADYHLLVGSPAIDAGVALSWVTEDIDGDPRPFGPAPDIGADEFVGTVYRMWLPVLRP